MPQDLRNAPNCRRDAPPPGRATVTAGTVRGVDRRSLQIAVQGSVS